MNCIKRNRWLWMSVIGALLCSAAVTGCMGGADDDDDGRPGVVGDREGGEEREEGGDD